MKVNHNKLEESDDDMDNLPLKYLSSGYKNDKCMKELKRHSLQTCEFCEQTFENKYDHLVHNAKHIIIPLIKMLPHHCAECNLYCISEEEINDHMSVKHKTLVKPKNISKYNLKNKVSDKCTLEIEDISEETNEDRKPLSHLINKKQDNCMVQNNIKENILENFLINCNVNVENVLPLCLPQCAGKDHKSNSLANFEPTTEPHEIINNSTVKLRTSAEVKSYKHDFKAAIDPSSGFSDCDDDPIIILEPVKEDILNKHSSQDSIHFEDLIKPGIFYCKRCSKRFPNRYEVIIHETAHMELFVGSESCKTKRKNRLASVTSLTSKQAYKNSKHVIICDNCDEEITDKNLHAKTCTLHSDCGEGFKNGTVLTGHKNKCNDEVSINMCDKCLYSKTRPEHIKYYGVVEFPDPKAKEMCDWCGDLSRSISLVALLSGQRIADRITFEDDTLEWHTKTSKICPDERIVTRGRRRGRGGASKTRTNWDRLKIIQTRLKLMKK